jgi:predicted enzyme related to lactoylglutathione lyase
MSRVVHFEIHADEPERAIQFYSRLFGWTFNKWDGPIAIAYWAIVTGAEGTPGINGGLLNRNHPITGHDGIIGYICTVQVDHLDQHVELALELGGQIALPKMPVPDVGWLAYIKDCEGNIVGLMEPEATAH